MGASLNRQLIATRHKHRFLRNLRCVLLLLCSFGFLTAFLFVFSKSARDTALLSVSEYVALIDPKLLASVDSVYRKDVLSLKEALLYFNSAELQNSALPNTSVFHTEHSIHTSAVNSIALDKIPAVEDDKIEFRYAVRKIHNISDHFEPFPFLVEPRVCRERIPAKMVIYVASPATPDDIVRRSIIRNSWAADLKKQGIEVVFSMGRDSKAIDNHQTADVAVAIKENELFEDILMANYRDSWGHVILNWWADNHYHALHCNHIPLMAYADSDSVFYANELSEFLDKHASEYEEDMGCSIIKGQQVEREEDNRYYISKHQWPNETLPDHCHGAFIMNGVKAAIKLSDAVPKLGIDYVSSFLVFDIVVAPIAQIADVKMRMLDDFNPWLPLHPADNICSPSMFGTHAIKPPPLIPAFLEYRRSCCSIENNLCPYDGRLPI